MLNILFVLLQGSFDKKFLKICFVAGMELQTLHRNVEKLKQIFQFQNDIAVES